MIYTPTQLFRILKARVTINGVSYQVVNFPEIDRDIDNMLATCGITLEETVPESAIYTTATVDYSIDNGNTWHRMFTGVLQPDQYSYAPLEYRYTITDILYKLDTTASEEISLSGVGYLDAIEDILLAAGIPSGNISLPSSVESDVVERATIAEYVIEEGDSLQSTMEDLLDFGRYRLYTDPDGIVRAAKYSRVPYENPTTLFSTQPLNTEYGVIQISNQLSPNQEIVNTVKVDGEGEDISGEWSTSEVSGKGISGYRNSFCTTVAQCEELAQDIGIDECRNERTYNVKMPTDHTLMPGTCIKLKAPEIAMISFVPVRVIKQSINGSTMDLVCSSGGRAIDDEGIYDPDEELFDPIRPPTASFNYSLEREASDYGLKLDASLSSSETGEIITYEWAFTGMEPGYPIPVPGNNVAPFTLIKNLEDVTCTLTITDSEGNTATTTQTITGLIVPITRMLSVIMDDRWLVLVNYDIGWYDVTPENEFPYILPKYQDSRYYFMLSYNGGLYRYDTLNMGTPPKKVYQFGSAGGHVNYYNMDLGQLEYSIESGNTLLITGKPYAYRSQNVLYDADNITFYAHTLPYQTTAKGGYLDYRNPEIMFLSVNEDVYASYDALVTLEEDPIYEGPELEEGDPIPYVADLSPLDVSPRFVGLIEDQVDPMDAITWYIDWSSAEPIPTTITALSKSHFYGQLYIGTSTGQIYLYDMGTGVLSHLITVPSDSNNSNRIMSIRPDRTYEEILWLRVHSNTYTVGKLIGHSELNSVLSSAAYAAAYELNPGDYSGNAIIPYSSLGYGPIGDFDVNFVREEIYVLGWGIVNDTYIPENDKLWKLELHKNKWTAIDYPVQNNHLWTYLYIDGDTFILFGATAPADYKGQAVSYISYDRGENWTEITYNQGTYPIDVPVNGGSRWASAVGTVVKYGTDYYVVGKCRLTFGSKSYYYAALFKLQGTVWQWQLNLTWWGLDKMSIHSTALINGEELVCRINDGRISFRRQIYLIRYNLGTSTLYRTVKDNSYNFFPLNYANGHGYSDILQLNSGKLIYGVWSYDSTPYAIHGNSSDFTDDTPTEEHFGSQWGFSFVENSAGEIYAARRVDGDFRAGVNKVEYPNPNEEASVGPLTCNEYDGGTSYYFDSTLVCSENDTLVTLDRSQLKVIFRDPNTLIWSAKSLPDPMLGTTYVAPFVAVKSV